MGRKSEFVLIFVPTSEHCADPRRIDYCRRAARILKEISSTCGASSPRWQSHDVVLATSTVVD